MLKLNNIKTKYGNITALKGVSITVNPGEIATIIGANGAGKTTTLNSISGIIKPFEGTIEFNGEDITNKTTEEIVSLGLIQSPEGRQIFPQLTVAENLILGAFTRKDKKEIAADLDYVHGLFPRLYERRKQLGGTLSGGEQQMLAIGRAMMGRPKLLLLDEPSLGLAPLFVKHIFEVILEINKQGTTILLVEQNAHMALSIANRGYVMETGIITEENDAKVLAQEDSIKKAYLGG